MADQLITGTTLIEDKRTGTGLVWSTPGVSFKPAAPQGDVVTNSITVGSAASAATDLEFVCPVELPNGATVTGAIVYGNAAAIAGITWTLFRVDHTVSAAAMASAAVGTEDTTISNEVINNNDFFYFFSCASNEWDDGDTIHGARIIYTL